MPGNPGTSDHPSGVGPGPGDTVLIANRGAVVPRVIESCRALGMRVAVVHSDADAAASYLDQADSVHAIGGEAPADSYLSIPKLLDAASAAGATAIHPGYGFLSENPDFAGAVRSAGMVFIGPDARWLKAMGHKTEARHLMAAEGMPTGPSSGVLGDDPAEARAAAAAIGFPVLVKPAEGGGGIGMLAARDPAELDKAIDRARTMAARSFGSAQIYLERLMERPRHVEFQILADGRGGAICLSERDCSVQRRHQKVIEEAVAPGLNRAEVTALGARLAGILGRLGYDNLGTVEMLWDREVGFAFLEVNTRLQVEHAVTEAVTGVDIVAAQIRLAYGEVLDRIVPQPPAINGHAVQARIYAEDPVRFLPSVGVLNRFRLPRPDGVRIYSGYCEGGRVTPFYDPLVAKVIAHGETRDAALDRLDAALAGVEIEGIKTNIPFLRRALAHPAFRRGQVHTGLAADILAA
ncbi:biotin carboxylase [Tistrella bauzanensis]|uniref:Biotin carboxylase n=1 Tax=Tistrella bauzanensis TaxID=657419 RepID=A0ABQ1I6U7_9PROT|nr:biotin carboxylase N-terminal domain-containing protein [Tistrella bauzanensis]GGB22831.1 biotin carboxylase [Tistrella bauzanensis]